MASVTGFKQECPSCGGLLTIRNPSLIGKKVDCPKCKYRFVIEAPDGDIEERLPGKSTNGPVKERSPGRAAGKGGKGRIKGAGRTGKKKQPAKQESSNKGLLILAGVGVGVLLIVGVVLLIVVLSGSEEEPPEPPPVAQNRPGAGAPSISPEDRVNELLGKLDNEADRADAMSELRDMLQGNDRNLVLSKLKESALNDNEHALALLKEAASSDDPDLKTQASTVLKEVKSALAKKDEGLRNDPTNLLPRDTQVLLNLPVRNFTSSPLGLAVFARGAFRPQDFNSRFGIPFGNIEQLVIACNKEHSRSFAVIKTSDAYDWDQVKLAMHVDDESRKTVNGEDYYVGRVDLLTEFLGKRMPLAGLKRQAAIHPKSSRLLVLGDVTSVERFLASPPKFNIPEPKVPDRSGGPGTPPFGPGGGYPGFQDGGGGGGAGSGAMSIGGGGPADSGSGAPPSTGGPGAGYPGAPPDAGGGGGAGSGAMSIGGGPGAGGPGAPSGGGRIKPSPRNRVTKYLTIDSKLRDLIERAENKKPSLLVFAEKSTDTAPAVDNMYYFEKLTDSRRRSIEQVALALQLEDELTLRVVAACRDRRIAGSVRSEMETILRKAAKGELKEALGFEFRMSSGDGRLRMPGSGGGFTGGGPGSIGPGGGYPGFAGG